MLRENRLEIALVVAITLLVAFYARASYVPSFHDQHVQSAEERYDYDVGRPGPWFSGWSLGDGQAFVMIALDPTGRKLDQEIEESGYRFARAGYGWAVFLAAAGQPVAIPYALLAVGLLSLMGLLSVVIRQRARIGSRIWVVLVNPAIYLGFGGDTSETLGVLLLVLAMSVSWWGWPLLLGVTRPSYLVALWGRWRGFALVAGAAGALGLYSLVTFGAAAMVPDGGRVGLPLVAYMEHSTPWGWILALISVATIVVGIHRRDWAWVLGGLFVLCFGPDVTHAPVNAWRAAGFIPVLWAFGPRYEVPTKRSESVRLASSPA